ncbi:MAG TPA: SDR family oxidoreductase, partial [Thermoanaerobaculia bacterium]|nr:SDR family oxidoreductase [Thermoanaerobaculia bacterium]
ARRQLDLQATKLRTAHAIAAVVHRSVDLERAMGDIARSLVELGGDSLAAMDLELRLGELFGSAALAASEQAEALATLPLAALAHRLATAEQAGEMARSGARAPRAVAEVPPAEPARPASEPAGTPRVAKAPSAELAALANGDAAEAVGPLDLPPPASGEDLLVTGANGFLGSHLVAHLASSLSASQRLWALLRAPSHEAAAERLQAALRARGLRAGGVVPYGAAAGSVVAVAAALSEERLGLSPVLYERLASEVGLIHHVAAEVAFDRNYAELRAANVIGTRRVLELSTAGTLKALHFVSSLNVFFLLRQIHGQRADETTPLPATLEPAQVAGNLGYTVSKWAAERLVDELFRRAGGAFRASISRPALLVWSLATGIGNDEDWFGRALASCLHMRHLIGPEEAAVPRWAPETPLSARGLDLVPIDFAARAVAHLGEQTRTGALSTSRPTRVPTFHVSNTTPAEDGLVTAERLMDLLACSLVARDGAALDWRFLPLADWALEAEVQGAPVLPVLHRLRQGWPAQQRTPAERFAATYPEPCPPFDQRSIEAWCVAHGV